MHQEVKGSKLPLSRHSSSPALSGPSLPLSRPGPLRLTRSEHLPRQASDLDQSAVSGDGLSDITKQGGKPYEVFQYQMDLINLQTDREHKVNFQTDRERKVNLQTDRERKVNLQTDREHEVEATRDLPTLEDDITQSDSSSYVPKERILSKRRGERRLLPTESMESFDFGSFPMDASRIKSGRARSEVGIKVEGPVGPVGPAMGKGPLFGVIETSPRLFQDSKKPICKGISPSGSACRYLPVAEGYCISHLPHFGHLPRSPPKPQTQHASEKVLKTLGFVEDLKVIPSTAPITRSSRFKVTKIPDREPRITAPDIHVSGEMTVAVEPRPGDTPASDIPTMGDAFVVNNGPTEPRAGRAKPRTLLRNVLILATLRNNSAKRGHSTHTPKSPKLPGVPEF